MGIPAYAGIGSRTTPQAAVLHMRVAAAMLAATHTLRSGHADGADQAFEEGCDFAGGAKEIWLPWANYNGAKFGFLPTALHMQVAGDYHPAWRACSLGAKRLHARNTPIILGTDVDAPVAFVLCWTEGGLGSGGTGQGLRIARANKIPIFDFGVYGESVWPSELDAFLRRVGVGL